MITLSLCMIVKNESDVIARCLTCIKDIADEIIVVDTGSTDDTKEIVSRFTDKVYDYQWHDDFAAARNFSFSKATMQYTMWLDADDVIDEENQQLLLRLKENLSPSIDMVLMRYDVAFDESGRPTMSYYRERIMRTSMKYQWIGEIHEVIFQTGNLEQREIFIKHQKLHPTETGRNLRIFQKMIADGKTLDQRQRYYYARELMYNGDYVAATRELDSYLADDLGWIENKIGACKDLANCLQWQKQPHKALDALLKSFSYDAPRAEICCDIGSHFIDQQSFQTAIFWYALAVQRPLNEENGAFCLRDCYDYIPYMQLCVCYDRIGDHKTAMYYNEKAAAIKPDDQGVLFNRQYFSKLDL
ncbi:MAG: glycosyltransferase family 2 protein [Clostridiales bacterium]|nr:glycosyltransferase family 2 protein [Clostridiales bacterium]